MPAQNTLDPAWDLDDLILIHGLGTTPDAAWAIEGIALDLGLTPEDAREVLRAHGVAAHILDT